MKPPPLLLAIALAAISGCASLSARESREASAAETSARQTRAAKDLRLGGKPLTLDDCVRIALERSLDLRAAELRRRIAAIETDIAFSGFLPRVDATWDYTSQSKAPLVKVGEATAQMSDQRVREFAIGVQVPVFTPQAWLLYSARQRGEEIADLVLERTRQQIALEATARYYACLALAEERESLAASVTEAERVVADARASEREGLLTAADGAEAELLLHSRQADVAANARAAAEERARLLVAMDLPPLASFEIAPAPVATATASDGPPLADRVAEALLRRPELHVADRAVDVRHSEVQMAIANFLPKLIGTGGFFSSSDSYLANPDILLLGLSAVVDLFDGLRKVGEYDAALAREEKERLARERTALAVVLEVVEAHRTLADATTERKLAEESLKVAAARLGESEARRREGLDRESERLAAITARDRARGALRVAAYREQVARAVLDDISGGSGGER